MFGSEIGRVKGVETFVGIVEWTRGLPRILGNEAPGNTDVAFGPFQLVKLGKIFHEILVGFERFCNLSKINDSSSSEFVPSFPDNGMG